MKEKNKTNPFGTVLEPTEEILWASRQRGSVMEMLFPSSSRWFQALIGLFMLFVVVMVFIVSKDKPFIEGVGMALLFLGFIVLRLFGGRIIGNFMSGNFLPTMPETTSYAVTNQRLLIRQGERISGLLLEKVPLMSALTSNGTRGTLSFGAVFPMWGNLENVQEVKSIIERAKKERIKEQNA